jgi:serine/threonine protein kinase
MGVVYRARDPKVSRDVALKLTTKQDCPVRAERFQREAQITASLDHPGVVRVHSAGHEDGTPWIAYELVEGHTLTEAFESAALESRIQMVIEAGQALGYAHSRGVVHRDIKPSNILVDATGRVRVADFGLALGQSVNRLTVTGAFLGTPLFMSPEQIIGESKTLTSASDVWSLGVILYLALTGEPPFDGENIIELGTAITGGDPTRPSSHVTSLPLELEAVCLRALQADPSARYPDGSSFAADLELAVSGRSEAGKERRQRRGVGVAIGALVLATAAVIAVAANRVDTDSGTPEPVSEAPTLTQSGDPTSRLNLSTVESALAARDLKGVLEELERVELDSGAAAEFAEIRRQVLAQGQDLLARRSSLRRLVPLFQIVTLLRERLPSAADPAFADAALSRALEMETASAQTLGDPAVLRIVSDLARAGLTPSPAAAFALVDEVIVDNPRPFPASAKRTYFELLDRMLDFELDLRAAHTGVLSADHMHHTRKGPRAQYLRILVQLDNASPSSRRRAYARLSELIPTASAKSFGRTNRARVLCMLAAQKTATSPTAPSDGFTQLNEALALAPTDPRVLLATAGVLRDAGVEALQAGLRAKAYEAFERALGHGLAGLRERKTQGYETVLSLRMDEARFLSVLVSSYALLGQSDRAEQLLNELRPNAPPSARAALGSVFHKYTTIRKRALRGDSADETTDAPRNR